MTTLLNTYHLIELKKAEKSASGLITDNEEMANKGIVVEVPTLFSAYPSGNTLKVGDEIIFREFAGQRVGDNQLLLEYKDILMVCNR